jgi:hypothetical protein
MAGVFYVRNHCWLLAAKCWDADGYIHFVPHLVGFTTASMGSLTANINYTGL